MFILIDVAAAQQEVVRYLCVQISVKGMLLFIKIIFYRPNIFLCITVYSANSRMGRHHTIFKTLYGASQPRVLSCYSNEEMEIINSLEQELNTTVSEVTEYVPHTTSIRYIHLTTSEPNTPEPTTPESGAAYKNQWYSLLTHYIDE